MKDYYDLRRRLMRLMLLACLLAMSQGTWADDFLEKASNYSCQQLGMDKIQITLPTQMWSSFLNEGVSDGRLYVTVDGGDRQTLLKWWCPEYKTIDSDKRIRAYQKGRFYLTGKTKNKSKSSFTKEDGEITYRINGNSDDDDHYTTTVEWQLPREYRGHRLKFEVWAHIEDRDYNYYVPDGNKDATSFHTMATIDTPEAGEASVTMNEPMLAVESGHVNEIMISYSFMVNKIFSATLYYTDAVTGIQMSKSLPTSVKAGFAYLPANRPWKDIQIKARVTDVTTKETSEEYRIDIQSDTQTSDMIHYPKNLKVAVNDAGQAVLTWTVDEPNQGDIFDGDFFEVQRNLTGSTDAKDSNWQTIDMSNSFETGVGTYTYTDAGLQDQYKGVPVSYRVRRSGTSMWQWLDGSGYSLHKSHWLLLLPSIQNATVQRTAAWNDDSHVAKFTFGFEKNLDATYDADGSFIIRTKADYEAFAAKVNGGETDLNAIMAADVNLGSTTVMVGSVSSKPYKGTFNGNGHSLTIDLTSYESNTAPFRFLGDGAYIKNLHVKGSVSCSGKFTAGLVAFTMNGNINIENCRVSAVVNSNVRGDATNGGIVAHNDATLSIRNCLFDGQLTGLDCNSNGGILGFMLASSQVTITDCLFAPTQITTSYDFCQPFARTDNAANLNISNSYYTLLYNADEKTTIDGKEYYILRNNNDWEKFREQVQDAKGAKEVNAIMVADFTVTKSVGYDVNAKFTGTFDGNGHTLNVNLSDNDYSAPFRFAQNFTIRNLHVTGTVSGGIHSSGLVAGSYASGGVKNQVNNCWVSVKLDCSSDHAGGFIGHGHTASHYMSECLFDGSISCKGGTTYAGAFVGWEQGGNTNSFSNMLENGSYSGVTHAGCNYSFNNGDIIVYGNQGDTKFYSYHSWNESFKAATITQSDLLGRLGSAWKAQGDKVVLKTSSHFVIQGIDAVGASAAQLLTYLGSQWRQEADKVVPDITVEVDDFRYPVVWDKRAKLKLRVNMHGANGIEHKTVDLSDNEDAITKHEFTEELTRKCVDYTFDLLLIRGTSPMKIANTDSDTLLIAVEKKEQGEEASYRFQNSNRIIKLESTAKQSSVQLTWETSGGDHDYFRILRRSHTDDVNAAWTDTIATNLNQLFFEDKTVLAQQSYDYRVESVYQCEGTNIETKTCTGACIPTGMIDGYVRMADGTAMAGVKVECRPEGTIPTAQSRYETYTDEAGYFAFRGLPFQGTGTYLVTIPTTGASGKYTGPNEKGTVNFSQSSNWTQNFNFYMDTYFVYSGNVFYRNTSIPVPGVQFKLDGVVMRDASQHPIETDTRGAFSLSIPAGPHSVQAVKDGHLFASKGFLINRDAPEDTTQYNFEKNISDVRIWDSTLVVLRGRVVGGDVQGSKPWGQGLSKNNLGDSIKIVMQLEGDNASYLILKQDDETVTSAKYDVAFGPEDKNKASINVTRHTLTIRPDQATGEYMVQLPPAKYKVIEVSAQGYATLFQDGKVGETIDLVDSIHGAVATYDRIYHSVPTVEVTQFNPSGEKFYGAKTFTAQDNIGNSSTVNIWYLDKNNTPHYSFGYPVFMSGSPYGFMLQACEKYYWNNVATKNVDIVNLDQRGKIIIKNSLTTDAKAAEWQCALDSAGGCSYIFTPDNPTYVMEGSAALKTVDITLLYDGNYYDIKPLDGKLLQGYVMATQPKSNGRKTIVAGTPKLWDILRDPPGGGSSAYIEEGSKLSYGYSMDVSATTGFSVKTETGTGADLYFGYVASPGGIGSTSGELSHAKTEKGVDLKFEANYGHSWSYTYGMDITERVQTKSGAKWIGGKADLFIGTTDNMVIQEALAVRVVPDSMYQLVKLHEGGSFKTKNGATIKVPVGTTKVLAQGVDNTGKPVYLVRDEVLSMSTQVTSTFFHSQEYIENELLPELIKTRNSLLLPMGTSPAEAKALANKRGYAAYISKVPEDHDDFGLAYEVYYADKKTTGDRIAELNNEAATWVGYLMKNEQEKLNVTPSDLVKRYDFDGGAASIQYSENFSTATSMSQYLRYPGLTGLGNLFSGTGILAPLAKALEKLMQRKGGEIDTQGTTTRADKEGNPLAVQFQAFGSTWKMQFNLILYANANDKYSTSETHTKKIGFTLSTAGKSSLTVDVYRTASEYTIDEDDNAFCKLELDMLDKVRYGHLTPPMLTFAPFSNAKVFSSFVFRTVGGVTCQPYEEERVTKWYQPGTVLDVATIPVDKPRIWIDQPVVSNVPFDEPARFVLHMANESDYPSQASPSFNYYILGSSNPKGAKICVDGKPLGPGGESIKMSPAFNSATGKHNVFTKELTVYPSADFDYEDLTICLYDPEDPNRVFSQKFSAHFIPTAAKVKVSVPSNNWVMNTESPYDSKRKQWYMPVRIEGFDINWPNFDHIELQYKLSTQGDKDWVNVCAYYADKTLKAKASGVTDTIPDNGVIIAPFYGESEPIEQYYDIRAVSFCRHAGGYLTRSSEVLKGIKDTRLPVAFGTPEPTNGILGIGDDIKVKFSEPIAGNYLRNINNFEVLGTLMSNDILTSTSLSFDGDAMAYTTGERNLAGKDFTVDIMVNPANENRDMTIFSHGGIEKGLQFGLTADHRLSATINGETVVSDSVVEFNNALHQIAFALDQSGDGMQLNFFDGSLAIGSKKLSGTYSGASTSLMLGQSYGGLLEAQNAFKGEMLEFRLWNRAMDAASLDAYGRKKISGYETGLLDYYPMNEGKDDWCYDKAPASMDMHLAGTSWKRPAGISVAVKGEKGLRLKSDKFARGKEHDYTMMFWFRTNDKNEVTLFSNGEANRDQSGQINIGVKDYSLFVRSSGFEVQTSPMVADGSWHHFAMTVSRSQNVANVYLDNKLVESFPSDSLSGIMGDHIALGATYIDKNTPVKVMNGNIDELGMFSSVLPLNLIKEYTHYTPLGTTSVMMAYLDFGRSQKMDDNTQRLEPTGISLKRYMDTQGKIVARRDTLVDASELAGLTARDTYAPMLNNTQLDNLKYSFVADGKELLINITEPDYMIERTNIYVTVKDVADLQGNLMASPITMNLYVYRNPLRWDVKKIEFDSNYGFATSFTAKIQNLSGVNQNFELKDIPYWLTPSVTQGTLGALDEQEIVFTVSNFINIGTYNEQIALVGDNTMSEPLPITIRVHDEGPDWAVSDKLKQINQTMMIVARVRIDGVIASSTDDVLGVFDDSQQTLGVAHIEVNNVGNANEALAYLTVYGYTRQDGTKPDLYFRFYNASTGNVYSVKPTDGRQLTFQKDAVIGKANDPLVLENGYDYVQKLKLKKGWNWVSFIVEPKKDVTLGQFLNSMSKWEVGDIISTVNGTKAQQFTCRQNKTSVNGYKWDHEDDVIDIVPKQMYSIYSMSDKTVYLEGDYGYAPVTVHKDWNRVGYISQLNLPIAQALSDYTPKASEGDVIKSQDGFAVASSSSTADGLVWKGSLQYLEAGKGYMIKCMDDKEVTFTYPQYYDSRYSGSSTSASRSTSLNTQTTMNLVAAVAGVEPEDGDKLVAYVGAERVAEAVMDDEQHFFVNIGSDSQQSDPMTFALEREGQPVAVTSTTISYSANRVLGTPSKPMIIDFRAVTELPADGHWYTLGGVRLEKKPSQSGHPLPGRSRNWKRKLPPLPNWNTWRIRCAIPAPTENGKNCPRFCRTIKRCSIPMANGKSSSFSPNTKTP